LATNLDLDVGGEIHCALGIFFHSAIYYYKSDYLVSILKKLNPSVIGKCEMVFVPLADIGKRRN
jgi:hypothetical protein